MAKLSEIIIKLSFKFPVIAKTILWLLVQLYFRYKKEEHWLSAIIRHNLNYTLFVTTKLENGMKITVPFDSVGKGILSNSYESDSLDLLKKILKPGMTFFDIGANVGVYTLFGSKIVGKFGKVYSFEPNPNVFKVLYKNIKKNNLKNVTLSKIALSDKRQKAKLYFGIADNLGATSLTIPEKQYSGIYCMVNCDTLDSYINKNKIKKVDVIKIDVEGSELKVFKHAKKLFSYKKKPIIIVEFSEGINSAFSGNSNKLEIFLKKQGYSLFIIGHDLKKYSLNSFKGISDYINVFAVPKEKLKLLNAENLFSS